MGKERGDKKGKDIPKIAEKEGIDWISAKQNPVDSAKLCGENKMRRVEGGGASGQNGSPRGNGWCPANFFKFFWKNDLRFSRSYRKKGADSKTHPLFSNIHTSDFAGSLPRCNPNFSHTKVAILGGIQQSVAYAYRAKELCFSIHHPFFSNSMKIANRFFEIFRKKLAVWEGVLPRPSGKAGQ